MKLPRTFFTVVMAVCFMAGCVVSEAAVATDASPVGTWTTLYRSGDGGWSERILVIENVDGKLTGTLRMESMASDPFPQADADYKQQTGGIPDRGKKTSVEPISDFVFKDGVISFKTEIAMRNGRVVVRTYRGKVEGDRIKGVSTMTMDGVDRFGVPIKPSTGEWVMKRAKTKA